MNAHFNFGFARPTTSSTLRLKANQPNTGILQIGTSTGVTFVNLVNVISSGRAPNSIEAAAVDAALRRIDGRASEDPKEWAEELGIVFAEAND